MIYAENTFVKVKNGTKLRFITKIINGRIFLDDGKVSGLPASPSCKFKNYEPL